MRFPSQVPPPPPTVAHFRFVPSNESTCPVVGTVESKVDVAPLDKVEIVSPEVMVAQTRSVPSKVNACPAVGAVAFKVVVAALDRDEMESFAERRSSTFPAE